LRPFPHKLLLLLALVYTLVNAVKPLTIDDTAYHAYAVQVAHRPLDPYGFSAYWWYQPEVANEILAPPLLAYWWAPAIRLFGDHPFLWKLWLMPLAVLLAYAVCDLGRRFTRELELPITALVLFSPAFLPTFNLMLDVPATALALAALALFCRACDRGSFVLAALAGLVAGLGMEMKYTVFLAPAAMLLYALFLGRLRFWPAAAVVAVQVFLGWEFLMSLLYGESHFLLHLRERAGDEKDFARLVAALVTNLGGVAWPAALLALAALGLRWRGLLVAGAAGLMAYLGVACFGGDLAGSDKLFGPAPTALPFEQFVFGALGIVGLVIGVAVVWRLFTVHVPLRVWLWVVREPIRGALYGLTWLLLRAFSRARFNRKSAFLLSWLALEVVGYLALTPFPAVRRVLTVVVVLALLAGRLAALTCRSPSARWAVWGVAGYSALLGLLVQGVDLLEARAEQGAVEEAARLIRERGEGGTVWYVGHWGFQYYAERAGMRPISAYPAPDDPIPVPPRSQLKEGDWLVLPEWRYNDRGNFVAGVHSQTYTPDPALTRPEFTVVMDDPIPLQTIMTLYSGYTPIRHHEGPRLQVEVRRVLADHPAGR
jgi:4-amino-4-deoxy-L-arabinose transferase-like glycosyltransferase